MAAFLIHCWSCLGGAEDEGLDVGGGVGGEVGGGGALPGDFGAGGGDALDKLGQEALEELRAGKTGPFPE